MIESNRIPFTKKCNKCLEIKLLVEFYTNNTRPDGKTTICKACSKLKDRAKDERHIIARYVKFLTDRGYKVTKLN